MRVILRYNATAAADGDVAAAAITSHPVTCQVPSLLHWTTCGQQRCHVRFVPRMQHRRTGLFCLLFWVQARAGPCDVRAELCAHPVMTASVRWGDRSSLLRGGKGWDGGGVNIGVGCSPRLMRVGCARSEWLVPRFAEVGFRGKTGWFQSRETFLRFALTESRTPNRDAGDDAYGVLFCFLSRDDAYKGLPRHGWLRLLDWMWENLNARESSGGWIGGIDPEAKGIHQGLVAI
ncbi:hypothetical protein JMJ77_0009409 [Colletotrichum scovillei]|uniref:Uncharacterized protein n=1 Tax=Colletotrichum scovillei TaxID=1209932 RepID=A0A9P7U7T6_9PEZI|nr:hypothetical protein JMJ77_0009409 [Colletotrichum scovillei]KAG7052488.1 hypothetical protein JMJ78_0005504 [Colletotrichum scovillei]KAG7064779.1 hypothetical protein JMJ76_0012537 [Colletotrichum scovillei]